jgi:predicted permease
MYPFRTIWLKLRSLGRRRAVKQEIDEELRFHIEQHTAEKIAAGMPPAEADRVARERFGNFQSLREQCREERGASFGEEMWQDISFGVRVLHKNPGFTTVAILTLALGIGANTAMFSIVNGVLLNPLPYPHPDQLVALRESKPNFEAGSISYPNFRDWQKENRTFAAMAISRGLDFILTGAGEPERVQAQLISSDFFPLLGVKPALGRNFEAGEDEIGGRPLVLISAAFWQRKLNSAPEVLGKNLTLDDKSYEIVGVMPANFKPPLRSFNGVDVYVPIGLWQNPSLPRRAAGLGISGIGRLKAGTTMEEARSDLERVSRNLAGAYPDTNKGIGATIVSLKQMVVGNVRPTISLLFGAVVFVLLIACVNVSNLLLARSLRRTREFAIRGALGAGHWRLLRQLLTESLLLALAGGALGLVVAVWATQAVLSVLPEALPRAAEVGLNARVLLFTIATSLLTGILASLAPALKISRRGLSETLKENSPAARGGRVKAQGVLIAVELALAVVLLIGAGLMIRSVNALWNVNPGFRPDNLLTFRLSFPPSIKAGSPEAIRAALRDFKDQVALIPGVQAASFSAGSIPLQNDDDVVFWLEGELKPALQSDMKTALVYRGDPAYLAAMGTSLNRGRFFTDQDNQHSPAVVVIDEVFAGKFFGTQDPVGTRLNVDGNLAQIVGVVQHMKQWGLEADDQQGLRAQIFEPLWQLADDDIARVAAGVDVMVRFQGEASVVFDSIHRVLQSRRGQDVIFKPRTMNEIVAGTLAARQFLKILLEAFAAAALLLAGIGLYGVISCLVGQRTQEFGIRLALGAQRREVLHLVLNQGVKMALAGLAVGWIAALFLTRLMAKMLFGVSAADPLTFGAISLLLGAATLLSCWLPARRAAKVDPMVALRHE